MSSSSSSIFVQVLEEERDLSDRDTDLNDSPDLTDGTSWSEARKKEEEEVPVAGGVSAGRQAVCHLLAPPLERSGRETPVSVDSIPLEWDHTVDVGGSSSHEDDEDATFFSALSGTNGSFAVLAEFSQYFRHRREVMQLRGRQKKKDSRTLSHLKTDGK